MCNISFRGHRFPPDVICLAAMKELGHAAKQSSSRWLNNRCENSHQLFRRRERAMGKFRSMKALQKFTAIPASLHNHFNLEGHLTSRSTFKRNRAIALGERRELVI